MKILQAEFVKSAPSLKECPEWTLPEIAMVGRSNVGKSSLINTLLTRKNLAQTSNTPGKTRLINFYNINNAFALVDLPGYGYARVSKTMKAQWGTQLETYLLKRPNRILVIQLIDARLSLQESDAQMMAWLHHHKLPFFAVLTKTDKLSKTDALKQVQLLNTQLPVDEALIIPFSAKTGWGKDAVWQHIQAALEQVQPV